MSFSNRQRAHGSALVSLILAGKRDGRRLFTARFYGNDVVAKTTPQKVGDLVFKESRKGASIAIQNNCVKFVTHKE